jgi:hypothetical protein
MPAGDNKTGERGKPGPDGGGFPSWLGGLIGGGLLAAAAGCAAIGMFGRANDAEVAFCPAAVLGGVGLVLLLVAATTRWMPDEPTPATPTASEVLLVWCQVEARRADPGNLLSNTIRGKLVGRDVRVEYPNRPGEHEVHVACPTCGARLTKRVTVQGLGAQTADAGCLWLGCLLPVGLVALIGALGVSLRERFGAVHLIAAAVACVAVFGGLFALAVRRIRRRGAQGWVVQFANLIVNRAGLDHHVWSRLEVGNEPT